MAKKSKKTVSRILAAASAAAVSVSMLAATGYAEENSGSEVETSLFYVEPSEIGGMSFCDDGYPINYNGSASSYISLKPGKWERWIDRINVPDELSNLYDLLDEWTDNDGYDDCLIDTSLLTEFSDGRSISTGKYFYEFSVNIGYVVPDDTLQYYYANMNAIFRAFMYDHPEIFWFDNGSLFVPIVVTEGGKWVYKFYFTTYAPAYNYNLFNSIYSDKNSIKSGIALCESRVNEILAGASSGSTYEKIKYFNNWLTIHNEYNYVVANKLGTVNRTVYECISALDGRTGSDGPVCAAYGNAMKVLCDKANIPCIVIDGYANGNHRWNYVQMNDGNWYLVDATWNDPSSPTPVGAISGQEREDYLLIGSSNSLLNGREAENYVYQEVKLLNQPDLCVNDYVPDNYETPKDPEYPDDPDDGEEIIEYAKFHIGNGVNAWYYVPEEEMLYTLNDGDSLAVGEYFLVEVPYSHASTKPNIFINNILADCQKNDAYSVWQSEVFVVSEGTSDVYAEFNLSDPAIDFVERLYQNTLGRGSDFDGLRTHVYDLKNGDSASTVAYRFAFSNEFQNSKLSNEEIVKRMYNMFLSRDPDPAGLENWVNILEKGCSVGYIFYGFTQSKEFGELCDSYGFVRGNWQPEENRDKSPNLTAFVSRLYEKILGRTPDVGGLNNHTGAYLENRDTYQLAYNFIFSSEFTNKKLSDSDYVDTLYRTFFNREPDNAGKEDWLFRMRYLGYSREQVLAGFVGSQECIDLVNSFGI